MITGRRSLPSLARKKVRENGASGEREKVRGLVGSTDFPGESSRLSFLAFTGGGAAKKSLSGRDVGYTDFSSRASMSETSFNLGRLRPLFNEVSGASSEEPRDLWALRPLVDQEVFGVKSDCGFLTGS
jgi:hypothetical protein